MKRKKWMSACSILVLLALVYPPKAKALFGEDIAYLIEIINQAKQQIQVANQIYQTGQQVANFVQNPGSIKTNIYRGMNTLDNVMLSNSNGYDAQTVQLLDETIRTTRAVMQTAGTGSVMTTLDAASLATMQAQQAQTVALRNQIQMELSFVNDVQSAYQNGGSSYGSVYTTARWIPR